MKKVILLNGAIRDTDEFILIIDFILHLRTKYASDVEVVVSTWHEDIAANQEVINWMLLNGIRVIGSASIDVGGPANVFRQWRTMEAGLSCISSDSLILKGRTDKFLLRKDAIEAFVSTTSYTPALLELVETDKLALEHISLSLPFMAKDMVYLGTVAAIRKIMHYSVRTMYVADHIFNGIGPECFLWLELCSQDQELMKLIQKLDFRKISNRVLDKGTIDNVDWSSLPQEILTLYKKWIEVFDREFAFISDVIACDAVPSWKIDEGSWAYQIGDRKEYDHLKLNLQRIDLSNLTADSREAAYLNSTKEYFDTGMKTKSPEIPFPDVIEDIRNNNERCFSDIVILRQVVIQNELSKVEPNRNAISKALHWNIRQRDRQTLQQAYEWMMDGAKECDYLSDADKVFVLERMVDFFGFAANHEAIEKTILNLPKFFKASGLLTTKKAEYYFVKRNLYKALYWFFLSVRMLPESLGANHGLGCTLLDLGYPRFALKYLRRAHELMPADQTASFTFFRCLSQCKKNVEAKVVMQQLSGDLRKEAERILGSAA